MTFKTQTGTSLAAHQHLTCSSPAPHLQLTSTSLAAHQPDCGTVWLKVENNPKIINRRGDLGEQSAVNFF
jgi:hypothetical protein